MTDSAPVDEAALVAAAWRARDGAHCDFSGFAVGVALRAADGTIHTGANVENASYNLGLCAERVALYHALTHGAHGFTHVVIATDTDVPTYPCGACRQVLWEFAPDAVLLLATDAGNETAVAKRTTVGDTLPHAFDKAALGR